MRRLRWFMVGILLAVALAAGAMALERGSLLVNARPPADVAAVAISRGQLAAIGGAELLLGSGFPPASHLPLIGK